MEEGLLNNCWNYFNEAQLSWDAYFSKWEVMAQEENVDDWDKDFLASVGAKRETKKNKRVVLRKQRIKSIFAGDRKKVRRSSRQRKIMDKEGKRVHCESSNQGRGNEIIHKTENQTNLECEVVNNKHFEADLKAIFIEILSENTSKVGMFSVLSRMFPGNENRISNFSLSTLIMEKNEFSISPVSDTILHTTSGNEFLRRDTCPCGRAHRGLERKYASAGFCNLTQIVDGPRLNLCRRDRLPNLNDSYFRRAESLFHERNWFGTINGDRSDPTQASDVTRSLPSCSPRYLEGGSACGLTVSRKESAPSSDTSVQRINQPASGYLISPEATLRKILSPSIGPSSQPPSSHHRGRKRKKINPTLRDSDDDSGDEKNNGNADSSPGRFLKIFCTPKRPRRCINSEEEDDSPAVIEDPEDEEDCFDIVDRVKNIENE